MSIEYCDAILNTQYSILNTQYSKYEIRDINP